MTYKAPIKDTLFVLTNLAASRDTAALPGFEHADLETATALVEECAKLCEGLLAPLNAAGDRNPAVWNAGAVTTTEGFGQAYREFASGGWQGLQHPVQYGGQGLPKVVATAAIEFTNSANLSFGLCPLLTDGAIEALITAASDELKDRYLPRMIAGQWTGTMNLTEPQAGSAAALRDATVQAVSQRPVRRGQPATRAVDVTSLASYRSAQVASAWGPWSRCQPPQRPGRARSRARPVAWRVPRRRRSRLRVRPAPASRSRSSAGSEGEGRAPGPGGRAPSR